ncbi:MAG: tail fiber protein [Candidatus Solibacter sp.]
MGANQLMGTITMFAGTFAPKGFMFCAGQILSIAQNSALFAILGTTFGGNGTTTFALPDLRSRNPIGTGPGPGLPPVVLGEMAGVPSTTLLTSNMPAHNHSVACDNTGQTATTPAGNIYGVSDDRAKALPIYSSNSNAKMNPMMCSVIGSNIPFTSEDPYLGMNYIICVQGIFPSRN